MTSANMRTVLITARNFDTAAADHLRRHGFAVRQPALDNRDPMPAELPQLLAGIDGWIVGSTNVGRELMTANPNLQIIARRGVGYEQIDLAAARDLGRTVTIAAGGNGPSVADHALGLMLAVCKQLVTLTEQMRMGDWTYRTGLELHGKTVGLVGLGRIGRLVARRLAGFDVRVLATDIMPDLEYAAAHGIELVDLPTLLRCSDIVSLHAPLTPATANLIDGTTLGAMRRDAILINTARGGLVDEAALAAALTAGTLAGAGLDVFKAEKDERHQATTLALVRIPTVVATPHTAAATREGSARTNMIAAETVVAVLDGELPAQGCLIVDGRAERATS